jgi:hypothetical protein
VVAEYKDDWRSKIQREESGWDSELYSSDGGEYPTHADEDEECTYSDPDCDENHCFCADKGYGYKPSGHKFHNVRDEYGKFVKKNW